MTVTNFVITVISGAVAMTISDWIFMGILAHPHFAKHPEVWRESVGGSQRTPVAVNTLLAFLSSFVFTAVCYHQSWHRFFVTGHVALVIWAVAALPLLVVNGLWIKMAPMATFWQVIGWLVRLELLALAVTYLLH